MPDWPHLVRERLGMIGLGGQREAEVRAELAEHLEDTYQDALQRGLSADAAIAFALEQVSDWQSLAQEICRAGHEEEAVTNTAKTLWVPGTTMLIGASLLLLAMTRLVPPAAWVDGRGPVVLLTIWVLSYLAFGAMGAYWSRQAGGDTKARFLSGVFPVALHLTIFVLLIIAAASGSSRFPEHLQLSFLVRNGLGSVVIPGVALAIGTLPFLRDRTPARA